MGLVQRLLTPSTWVIGVLALGLGVAFYQGISQPTRKTIVDVAVPTLSAAALGGQALFAQNCAACHGMNGSGSDKGPPLIHDIYNPGHHSDISFHRAAQYGVQQHHWSFGNMPPQPQVTEKQVDEIVLYIRELQVANDIRYRPHRM
ncbi:MAG: cytochrome c [Hyphomicrobiaceae bacterium]|nr:cytochrome c [Hyphomicrobiaceae bacterium]